MNWPCIRQGLGRCRPLAFLYIRGATLGSGKLPPILPGVPRRPRLRSHMPPGKKSRCRFIDDCAEESDRDGDSDTPVLGSAKKKRVRRVASSDESGDDVPTAEDLAFVADDHESSVEEVPSPKITRRERRLTRDDIELVKENMAARKGWRAKRGAVRGAAAPKKKERTVVWKDSDEDDVHSSDDGFVVADDEEEEEEDEDGSQAEEAPEDEGSEEGEVVDDETVVEGNEMVEGNVRFPLPRELTFTNIVPLALKFRREEEMPTTSLSEVLERMHMSGRWVLAPHFMCDGLPGYLFDEFAARCEGCTVMTAALFGRLRVPSELVGEDLPRVSRLEPTGNHAPIAAVTTASTETTSVATQTESVAMEVDLVEPAPTEPTPTEPAPTETTPTETIPPEPVPPEPIPPEPIPPVTTPLIHPKTPFYSKPPGAGQSRLVKYFGPPAGSKPLPPPTLFPKGKGAPKADIREPPTGLIMRKDGTCYFRHDDGRVEERERI